MSHHDEDFTCDCHELERWKAYAKVLGSACVVMMVGLLLVGWLGMRISGKLGTTPNDVMQRVKLLEDEVRAVRKAVEDLGK